MWRHNRSEAEGVPANKMRYRNHFSFLVLLNSTEGAGNIAGDLC